MQEANLLHNNKYLYTEYKNALIKIKIICQEHGPFEQTPNAHLRGRGCPFCRGPVSKISQKWLDLLNIPKENREKTIKLENKKYLVDAYDPDTNTIYEFNGDFWHGNPNIFSPDDINPTSRISYGELYHKTIEKQTALMKAGYNFVSIWEADFLSI